MENDFNIEDDISLMKNRFNEEMKKYGSKGENVVKKPWTRITVESAIRDIIDSKLPQVKKTNRQYALVRKYDTMEMCNKMHLIKKRHADTDPAIIILPIEDYFETLLRYHRMTGHGGREKMQHALKDNYYITKPAIQLFVSMCTACNTKKTKHHRSTVDRPPITKEFNARGNVDLIDFQSSPCRDHKWLMSYVDCDTKFCHLRPLKSDDVREVASGLLEIFLEFGAPKILQSGSAEMTAAIVGELKRLWRECGVFHGRSRHPQSQESVNRFNRDVKSLLCAWMRDNNSADWAIGCRFVQWQKNVTKNQTTGVSSYKSVFGVEPDTGMTNASSDIMDDLKMEGVNVNMDSETIKMEGYL